MGNLSLFSKGRGGAVVFGALALLALFGQPLLAGPAAAAGAPSANICPPPVSDGSVGAWITASKPLQPSERLVYGLAGLPAEGLLEIRYLVDGKLHLTETINLAQMELPLREGTKAPARKRSSFEFGGFVQEQKEDAAARQLVRDERAQGKRVIELLAFHPDTVSSLHVLASEDADIDLEVSYNGRVREKISLPELLGRSAAMRGESVILPMFAPSVVSGPGIIGARRTPRVSTNDYLPDCGDCTSTTPCETECGWDPGKGGPVTCGEYGVCQATCAPSWTANEYWTAWTYYSSGYGPTKCLLTSAGSRTHNELITTYRRERIRVTTTCPNSPSCNGCYQSQSVIQVQFSNSYCYQDTFFSCFNGQMPCCATCSVYGWSTCGYGGGCF